MKGITLNIGGKLETGDVVGISNNNYMSFGWFVDSGSKGSLKYIPIRSIRNTLEYYDRYQKEELNTPYWDKKFSTGITLKSIGKDYIISYCNITNRAFKIPNGEEFFQDSDLFPIYMEGREMLNKLKFPAK
jgi:hypothetical protein